MVAELLEWFGRARGTFWGRLSRSDVLLFIFLTSEGPETGNSKKLLCQSSTIPPASALLWETVKQRGRASYYFDTASDIKRQPHLLLAANSDGLHRAVVILPQESTAAVAPSMNENSFNW